jgi:hypothetical protein
MYRTYRVSVPATGISDPTTEVYSFQTGDRDVWLQAGDAISSALVSEDIYSGAGAGPLVSTDKLHLPVGPGDSLRVVATTAASVRVLVRSVEA